MTNKSNTLYVGVTNDLQRRIAERKGKTTKGFTAKDNINKLIFYESFNSPRKALAAEKRIKGWTRKKKIKLIKNKNQDFKELII